MIRQELNRLIKNSIKELQQKKIFPGFDIPEIQIEHPEELIHGDYSTNIALLIAKQVKKNPMETAEDIKRQMLNVKSNLFGKIETAKPGFINFFLSKEYLQEQVREILRQGEKYGELKVGKGQKVYSVKSRKAGAAKPQFNRVNIEFISANPTGPLHIGNGRSAFFGDALANVLEKAGFKVIREYFINNAKNSGQIQQLGKTAIGESAVYLNEYLRLKIKNQKAKIKNVIRKFKDKEKIYSEAGCLLAQEIQKDNKDFIEKKLKIKFNNWISENDLYKKTKIKKIFDWLKKENLVYEKDEAWWVKTSQFGDKKDWVVIRETGEPTYLLSDIAYHRDKFERGFQKIIDIWGADHQAHVSKIKAAARMLGFGGSLDILILQLVTLKGKEKISKRTGRIITLEDLINKIGLDVARFLYLQKSLDTHTEIDLTLAKEQSEKNPVYYVQYAHARICSILRKAKSFKLQASSFKLLNHQSEIALIKQLIRSPEIIEDTARDYQLQRLPQYAIDLAASFHQFYRDCRVLSEDKPLSQARLGLISATKSILKNTLELMGISAPEKM